MGYVPCSLAAIATAVCSVLWTGPTSAQVDVATSSEDIRLLYAAPPGCPDRERFVMGLNQLSDSLNVRTQAADDTPLLILKIESVGLTFRGTLQLGTTERQVESPACADAAYALALIAVITLDPDAQVPVDVSAAQFTDSASAAAHSTPDAAQPAGTAPKTSASPLKVTLKPTLNSAHTLKKSTTPQIQLADERPERSVRIQLFAGPGSLAALEFGAQLGLGLGERQDWGSLWLEVSGARTSRGLAASKLEKLTLAFVPSACAHVLGRMNRWGLDACLGGRLGAARVSAKESVSFRATGATWSPSASAFLELALTRELSKTWSAGLALQGVLPFRRDRYAAVNLDGEETASVVESRITGQMSLQAAYAF